ncbi:AraC family transcriptional regulator [Caproiciproducens sp.]
MSAQFLSRTSVYQGNYRCIMYNPDCEFGAGLHYHDFYEIQFYFSDAGTLLVGNKQYEMRCGDVALINIFEPHTFCPAIHDYHRFCISMNPSFLLSMCSEQSDLLNIFSPNNRSYPVYHLGADEFKNVQRILSEYEQTSLSQGEDILERAFLYHICAHLYNSFYDCSHQDLMENQYVAVIAKLVQYICEHIKEDLSLDRLASVVNFSTFHICRVFKKYTGYTLTKYIVSKRIERAKFLLKEGEGMSITDICHETGFNNYSYFYKTFKKITGISPADYKLAAGIETEQETDDEFNQAESF